MTTLEQFQFFKPCFGRTLNNLLNTEQQTKHFLDIRMQMEMIGGPYGMVMQNQQLMQAAAAQQHAQQGGGGMMQGENGGSDLPPNSKRPRTSQHQQEWTTT